MRHRRLWLVAVIALTTVLVGLPAGAEAPEPILREITESTVLDADHYGSIQVSVPDVTLDCAGHTIFGPGFPDPYGEPGDVFPAVLVEAGGVTVQNCNATGFDGTAFVAFGGNSTLIGNTAYDNGGGFGLWGDEYLVKGNTSINSEVNAFLFQVGSGSSLIGNRAEGSAAAFSLELVDHIELLGNIAVGNGEGVGFEIAGSSDNVLRGNTATGYDVGFATDVAEDFFTGELVSSDRNVLVGNDATRNNGPGFLIAAGSNHAVEQNVAARNGGNGFFVRAQEGREFPPSGVRLTKNKASRNGGSGFLILEATGTIVHQNTATRNQGEGGFTASVADGASTEFTRNTACKNAEFDAIDFSDPMAFWDDNNFCAPDQSIPPQ